MVLFNTFTLKVYYNVSYTIGLTGIQGIYHECFLTDLFTTCHKVVHNGGSLNLKGWYSIKRQIIWLKFCKALVTRCAPSHYQNSIHLGCLFQFWVHPPLWTEQLVAIMWRHQKQVYIVYSEWSCAFPDLRSSEYMCAWKSTCLFQESLMRLQFSCNYAIFCWMFFRSYV